MSSNTSRSTNISIDYSKVYILATFYEKFRDAPGWDLFWKTNDIGLPLAHLLSTGAAIATDSGEEFLAQTWELFCKYVGVPVDNEYGTLWELLDNAENVK